MTSAKVAGNTRTSQVMDSAILLHVRYVVYHARVVNKGEGEHYELT